MMLTATRSNVRLNIACLLLVLPFSLAHPVRAQPASSDATGAPSSEADGSADIPSRIRQLSNSDPAAAVAFAEPLFASATDNNRAAIGIELAESYVKAKRVAEAQSLLDKLTVESGSSDTAPLLRLRLLIATANHDWDQVDALAVTVDAVAASTRSSIQRAELWSQFGTASLAQNKFPEAQAAYQNALEAIGDGDSVLHFDTLQKLGVAQAQQGHYPDAIESFTGAEAVGKRIGRSEDPTFLLRFGGVFLYTGDSAHAIAYLTRALAAADLNPNSAFNRAPIYNNLGTAYFGEKNFEQAAHWFETSIAYTKQRGGNIGHALNNLGAVLREWGRNREALIRFEQALALGKTNKDKEAIAISSKNIGESLIELGERNKAVAPLEQAYAIYAQTDQRPKRLELYPVMIDNFEALGRSGDALKLMREYKALNDDVVNVESRERVSRLETAIDLAEKQKQLVASERDRTVQATAIDRLESEQGHDRLVNRGLIVAIAALAVLIVLQIRDRWLKARAHRELARTTEQIEAQRRALEALNDVVRRQSQEDVLTGLKNRRFLSEWMLEANRRRASDGETLRNRAPMLLILIDIDHFKDVNDQFGHAAGDRVLAEFAGILRDCHRDSDLIVRWGGEEFVWLCPDTPFSAAVTLCNRLRAALSARALHVEEQVTTLTVSMGFSEVPPWPGTSADWQLAMRIADAALYECKSSGRDRWLGYTAGSTPDADAISKADVAELVANGNLVRFEMTA